MKNIFAAFQEKSFLFLWLGEVFTQVAVNLFNFYLILVVFSLTKSNTAVAGAVISFTIPAIIFGIPAGVYVDRWNKKKVLYITNIIRAFLLILLFFVHTNLPAIYIISFLFSLVTQFFIPAETPMIPLLVKARHLLSANALFGIGIYGSILLAYVLSGPLLLLQGSQNMLLTIASLLIMSAVIIAGIRMPDVKSKGKNGIMQAELAIRREIHSAISELARSKAVYSSLFLLAMSQVLILLLAAIAPGYANLVLDIKVEEFPLLFIAPGALGMIIGGGILVHFFENVLKDKLITIGTFLASIAMIILPFCSAIASRDFIQTFNTFSLPDITNLHILVVVAFILGIANALVFVPSNTILQEKTADESRGKIYGVLNAVVGVFSLVPLIVVGGLSDLVGIPAVIIGIGVLLFVVGLTRFTLHK